MIKIVQITSVYNSGSVGRISYDIAMLSSSVGYESYAAYGVSLNTFDNDSNHIKIGSAFDRMYHAVQTRMFDNHGFASKTATKKFISNLRDIKPDIVHLHNIHGYYLNVELLFNYLKSNNIAVVWTLHDCWPFTGHCSYFDRYNCNKWEDICEKCPNKSGYPKTFIDNSKGNYIKKKIIFNGVNNLTIVCPSIWLSKLVKKSFLNSYNVSVINNGVDLDVFKPRNTENVSSKYKIDKISKVIIGVASIWDKRKGLADFIELSTKFTEGVKIILVGLTDKQLRNLPTNIIGIPRTENIYELAELYSLAHVFVNPTYIDNFPTTNIEALACGTPVVTYDTGGSPEVINQNNGLVVPQGDIEALISAVQSIIDCDKIKYSNDCRQIAIDNYDKSNKFMEYIDLFKKIL